MGFFSKLFGKGDETTATEPARGMSKEDALSAYVVREHRQGRSLEDILDDAYLKKTAATDEQRLRLLERPEVIRAVGEDTAAVAAERVRDVS